MISKDRWQRIKQVLQRALTLERSDLPGFLDAACDNDQELRAEVESLLAYRDTDADFLDQPAIDFLGAERHETLVGQTLGHFVITERLASGGMGEVYLAEQQVPLKRTVAVKRIRPGMGTAQFLARFDLERQVLALMNHPNIAQVYDAGSTDSGQPYVVMEYVAGEPITKFCDQMRLTVAERIALMLKVCNGVEHAHQKGVIHGDLKPSNVLIDAVNGSAHPKIIDFGVARLSRGAKHADSNPSDAVAGFRQRFGSPGYASPEQLADNRDIDTRSDVYSLGALLYELLTGMPTEKRNSCEAVSAPDDERKCPLPPSEAVGNGNDDSTKSACENRRTRPASLARQLRGDLDWIVGKALATEREGRYATVTDLKTDLNRFLSAEPTLAAGDRRGYRIGKFLKRHAVAVCVGFVVAAALLTATVATGLALLRAIEAERIASVEAATTRQVSEFLVDLFRVTDPREAMGRTVTAREVVDNGLRRLESGLDNAPEVEAALVDTIGTAYMQLGLFDDARPLLEKGLALRETHLGNAHPDYAESLRSIGLLAYFTGAFDQAEERHRQAMAVNIAAYGPDHERVATNLHNIGSAVDQQGRWVDAEAIMRESLELRRRSGKQDEAVASTLNNLAGVLRRQGKPDEARTLYEQALAVRRAIGHDRHPDTAMLLNNLGVVNIDLGNLEAATGFHEEALRLQRELLGEKHPAILTSLTNLASVLVRQRRLDLAEPLLRESAELHRQTLGNAHLNTAHTLNNLGTALHQDGRFDEGIDILRDAIDAFRDSVGLEHPLGALARLNLANALVASGRAAEAQAPVQDARRDLAKAGLPDSHPLIVLADAIQGAVLSGLGDYAQAEPLLVASLPGMEKAFGARSPRTEEQLRRLSAMYEAWGKPERSQVYASRLAEYEP